MERGGFHGYKKPPKSSPAVDRLPELADVKQPTVTVATAANDMQSSTPTVREQDRYMPIANVIRIMRKVLPTHAKISDDTKETVQECVSEFISFITSEANDRCQREQRKTITAEDLLWAMNKLGFDDYIEPLSAYLLRYREQEGDHRGSSLRSDPPPCLLHKRHAADHDLASYGRANFNPLTSDGYDGATTSGSDAMESKRSF